MKWIFFGFPNSVWVRNWKLKTRVLKTLILAFQFQVFSVIADCYSLIFYKAQQSNPNFELFFSNYWENSKLKYELDFRFWSINLWVQTQKKITQNWEAEFLVYFNRATTSNFLTAILSDLKIMIDFFFRFFPTDSLFHFLMNYKRLQAILVKFNNSLLKSRK